MWCRRVMPKAGENTPEWIGFWFRAMWRSGVWNNVPWETSENPHLAGGFKYFVFSHLLTWGRWTILRIIFFNWVETTNQSCLGLMSPTFLGYLTARFPPPTPKKNSPSDRNGGFKSSEATIVENRLLNWQQKLSGECTYWWYFKYFCCVYPANFFGVEIIQVDLWYIYICICIYLCFFQFSGKKKNST